MSAPTWQPGASSLRRRCAARPAAVRPGPGRDTGATCALTRCSSSSCRGYAAGTAGGDRCAAALVRRAIPVRKRRRDRRGARALGRRDRHAPDRRGPCPPRDDRPRLDAPVRAQRQHARPDAPRRGGRSGLVRVRAADRGGRSGDRGRCGAGVCLDPPSRSRGGLARGRPHHRRDPARPQHDLALGRRNGGSSDGRDIPAIAWT